MVGSRGVRFWCPTRNVPLSILSQNMLGFSFLKRFRAIEQHSGLFSGWISKLPLDAMMQLRANKPPDWVATRWPTSKQKKFNYHLLDSHWVISNSFFFTSGCPSVSSSRWDISDLIFTNNATWIDAPLHRGKPWIEVTSGGCNLADCSQKHEISCTVWSIFDGKMPTISMAMFNSYISHYQRVDWLRDLPPRSLDPVRNNWRVLKAQHGRPGVPRGGPPKTGGWSNKW